ncbi:hypothetical protein FOZ62_010534, partial [Perkinsus olseni]
RSLLSCLSALPPMFYRLVIVPLIALTLLFRVDGGTAPQDVATVSEPGQNLPPSEVDEPISILRKKGGDVKKKGGISFNETVRVRPIERLVSSDDDDDDDDDDNYYGEDEYVPLQDEESDTSEGESSDTNEEEE